MLLLIGTLMGLCGGFVGWRLAERHYEQRVDRLITYMMQYHLTHRGKHDSV